MIYDVLIVAFGLAGFAVIAIAYANRNPERSFFSQSKPANPTQWQPIFRNKLGYRLGVAGAMLLSASGLVGTIRIIVRWLN